MACKGGRRMVNGKWYFTVKGRKGKEAFGVLRHISENTSSHMAEN
jgi:hypothetical protein